MCRHRRAHPTESKGPQRVTGERDGNTMMSLVFLWKEEVKRKGHPRALERCTPLTISCVPSQEKVSNIDKCACAHADHALIGSSITLHHLSVGCSLNSLWAG